MNSPSTKSGGVQLPTPAPTPPPATPTPDLPAQINAATRKQHTELNRLIIERLSLALPPRATDLTAYGLGLTAFAQIFFAFESKWRSLEAVQSFHNEASDGHKADVEAWLATLRPQGLARTRRLQHDLQHLAAHSRGTRNIPIFSQDIIKALHARGTESPHILVAYGWVMYMAIFSGGRWIRQQLVNAGPDFWKPPSFNGICDSEDSSPVNLSGFTFLSFDGEHDGEDIKSAFKAKLAVADSLLTDAEKSEVVETARDLFAMCIEMVQQLDVAVARQKRSLSIGKIILVALFFVLLAMILSARR